MTNEIIEFPARILAVQREEMLQPHEVAAMVRPLLAGLILT
jgi:hypothetical protein